MTADIVLKAAIGVIILIMTVYYLKRKRKIISLLFGAVTGAAALMLVNKYGSIIDTEIPLNIFNISGSLILGVPFVICIIILANL